MFSIAFISMIFHVVFKNSVRFVQCFIAAKLFLLIKSVCPSLPKQIKNDSCRMLSCSKFVQEMLSISDQPL
jgi:hypothetical protein